MVIQKKSKSIQKKKNTKNATTKKKEKPIYIGADHAGFALKEKIKKWFDKNNISYVDLGAESYNANDDYPDVAVKMGKQIIKNKKNKGILICGSGFGVSIAANKIEGVRAVAAYDTYTAKMSRLDNDANVLSLRGRDMTFKKTQNIISTWLKTSFSNISRHKRRIKKIHELELHHY